MSNSLLRIKVNTWLEQIAMGLNLQDKDILEIGIAGDPKPSGSHQFFGEGNRWKTMDINPKWAPDIVDDITRAKTKDNSFDLIIMTQTLEHIWDYDQALKNLHRITRKHIIVDCPWMYPFHQDAIRSEEDGLKWDDYWRFSPSAMYKLLTNIGFKKVKVFFDKLDVLCLAEK